MEDCCFRHWLVEALGTFGGAHCTTSSPDVAGAPWYRLPVAGSVVHPQGAERRLLVAAADGQAVISEGGN